MQSALFQRKSRSGWLEELNDIRQDALDQHDGGVAPVGEADDIWTDLRDGGEYEDPHEISSLYATDATPDRPVARAARPPAKPAKTKAAPAPAAEASPPAPAVPEPTLLPPPPVADAPPPPSAPVEEPAAVEAPAEVRAEPPSAPASRYDDQIWVQPSPHPMRPSEMWHPAELAPAPLPEETFEPIREERVASADLMDPTYRPVPEPAPVPEADHQTVARLESELSDVADLAVAESVPSAGGLVNGPVGRRVRRDRPVERPRASLPPAEDQVVPGSPVMPVMPVDRGEQSPLPSAPLPPAALPTRSMRLPDIELPATPSSVVAPRTISATPAAPTPAPSTPAPPSPAPPATEPVVAEPVATAPPAPAPIAIGVDGLVDAPGTIVRIGGARRARAVGSPDGVRVALDEGWCWASPGEGAAAALRIDLPGGELTIEPGATALAVVEADTSIFIIVAAGSAHLSRSGDGATVGRGTIVMIDPSGAAQTDAASDAEIEADPIVAENLALDAEL